MDNPIDVVIPLNHRSFWNDNELKYALRSVQKHLKNYRDIFIIGNKPRGGIFNVGHIPFPDQFIYPARNIFAKVMKACKVEAISDNFLFMNDDHFLLHNFEADKFPFFFKGFLREDLNNQTDYKHTIENTINVLNGSHPLKNFDTHTPILYNKKRFVETLDLYDWDIPHAYAIKSLYCNVQNIVGVYEPDGKIRRAKETTMLRNYLSSKKVFSIDDTAINSDLEIYFKHLYPDKSKYEL
jgi:hypothetical protein